MKAIVLTAVLALAATQAWAAPVTTVQTGLGDVLAGENGMTLYTFRKDVEGVSNCYDKCAANWPPLAASASDQPESDYTIIERKDGSKQWAKAGKPLYFWVKDQKKGDTTGHGVMGVWDVAKP